MQPGSNLSAQPRKPGYRLAAAFTVLAIIADQVTKAIAERSFTPPIVVIPGWLDFRFAENTGASFSSFLEFGTLIGFAVIGVSFIILRMLSQAQSAVERAALAIILGGATGNLVDRFARGDGVLDGPVVDWINFRNFPTFNLADSFVFIGAVILLWSAYRKK